MTQAIHVSISALALAAGCAVGTLAGYAYSGAAMEALAGAAASGLLACVSAAFYAFAVEQGVVK